MRKFILITAMVLASASAQAGVSRGLTLASNDEPVAAVEQAKEAPKETIKEAPKAVETPSAETPKFVDRPAPVNTTTEAPKAEPAKAEPAKTVADKNPQTPKVEKPKRRRESTEARVIYELHRYGIYW
jgi:outer membrane biosynthesis protein TonB